MQIYEVRISHDALQDMARLRTFLLEMMSEDGAVRYANNMSRDQDALRLCRSLQEDQFQDILTDSSRSPAYGVS